MNWHSFWLVEYLQDILEPPISWISVLHHSAGNPGQYGFPFDNYSLLWLLRYLVLFFLRRILPDNLARHISCMFVLSFTIISLVTFGRKPSSVWLTFRRSQNPTLITLLGAASVSLHTSRAFSHSLFPASLTYAVIILRVTSTWKFPSIWLTCWKPQSSSFIVLPGTASVPLHTFRAFSHSFLPASLTFTAIMLLVTSTWKFPSIRLTCRKPQS